MKKSLYLICILMVCLSCKKETSIVFSQTTITLNESIIIDINIPKAEGGTEEIITNINNTINTHISNQLNFKEDTTLLELFDAIKNFNAEYLTFKSNSDESNLIWEATFDGEVMHQSSEVICIPITTYINTGGAHGNLNIAFLNFNPKTGELFLLNDIINNNHEFKVLAETYFKNTFQITANQNIKDYFFGGTFRLPETIGFNNEGLLLFYNTYEIAISGEKLEEIVIPFEKINSYLKVH